MFNPRLGLSLHRLDASPTDEALSALARSRVLTLEVMGNLFRSDPSRKPALQNLLARTALRAVSVHAPHGWTLDLSSTDTVVQETALASAYEAIGLAADLRASFVVIHASGEPVPPDARSRRCANARRALSAVAGRCREANCRLAVELLPRSCIGNTLEELRAVTDGLDPAVVGFCLDTNHLMGQPQALPGLVRAMGERLLTLHLSDYDGVDEKHWLPGKGVLPWPAFMTALHDIGYTGPFNFECSADGATADDRLRSYEATFDWLTGFIPS